MRLDIVDNGLERSHSPALLRFSFSSHAREVKQSLVTPPVSGNMPNVLAQIIFHRSNRPLKQMQEPPPFAHVEVAHSSEINKDNKKKVGCLRILEASFQLRNLQL